MTAVEKLQQWAKEVTSGSAVEIAKAIDLVSETLDAREDLGIKMTQKEYNDLNREVEQMQRMTLMLASPWLRETYQELFVPLMIRLPKFRPKALRC